MPHEALISRIEAVARKRGVEPSTITRGAVQNRRLYKRLKAGGDLKLSTATTLEEFLALAEADGDKHPHSDAGASEPPQDAALKVISVQGEAA